ncbi:hypothetical protein DPMN_157077 [Dreissena polymorpha]|uniref:Uncharacterized protein n=1 Tax=Dreissena polymorpha TaxID=45954 RepID=A0A9D4EIM5_DREPO|nr:hypothetical protein DPMN_157077 [Dreissena polymorpha]
MQIDTKNMIINRAHRLGAFKLGNRSDRPIIACFMNCIEVEYILSNAKTLKSFPGYSIDRDVPKEISEARKRIWPLYKDTKEANPDESVRIVYPAKLICGKTVVKDEFPDWNQTLSQTRLVDFPILDDKSNSNVDNPPYHITSAPRHAENPINVMPSS